MRGLLVPDIAEAKSTVERLEGKLDRVVGLLELILTAQLQQQGLSPAQIVGILDLCPAGKSKTGRSTTP